MVSDEKNKLESTEVVSKTGSLYPLEINKMSSCFLLASKMAQTRIIPTQRERPAKRQK